MAAASPVTEVVTDARRPWLGRFLQASGEVRAGGLLVREKYLTFVSLHPIESKGHAHLELYRAVAAGARGEDGREEQREGSAWGRWGAGLDEIRKMDFDIGDDDYASQIERDIGLVVDKDPEMRQHCWEDAVYLARVFGKNSFSFDGEDGRRNEVIFPTISRASHSCAPNATIREGSGRDESLLVALRPIPPGEPIKICYLPDEYLLCSTAQRRAAIRQEWGFACRCDRCEAPLDLTRQFAFDCAACGSSRFAFAAACGGLVCCGPNGCGARLADAAREERALREEEEAENVLSGLSEPEDLRLPTADTFAGLSLPAAQSCFGFAKAHPSHRVAAEVSRRRVAALFAQSRWEEAAAAQSTFVSLLRALLPEGLRGQQWLAEVHGRLAYVSELAGRRAEAKEAAARVLDNLEVVFNSRPVVQTLGGMFESEAWHRFLDDVAPELNCLY